MQKLTLEEFGLVMQHALSNQYHFNQRHGQSIFNATYELFPELADSLRTTGAGCFYNDNKIIHFVNAILE